MPPASLRTTLLTGLAPDGGLYLPQTLPKLSQTTIAAFRGQPYETVAETILTPFLKELLNPSAIQSIIARSTAQFRSPKRVPLSPLKLRTNSKHAFYCAELFHGPTYAFKDFALQFLAALMQKTLSASKAAFLVLGATSGDTGAAAIAAFKDQPQGQIVILHPHKRISPLQRRQMTTTGSPRVTNFAIRGSFDDCQRLVKACFNDPVFRSQLNAKLIAVNSINWTRILAQTVYYFVAAAQLPLTDAFSPISFAVPTGNFGDIFAGYIAAKMGLPIQTLIVATNTNAVLHQFFSTNNYAPTSAIAQTHSPSMDIAAASNLERLLYYALNEDSESLNKSLQTLQDSGSLSLPQAAYKALCKQFFSTSTNNTETLRIIKRCYEESAILLDPHSAVGLNGALSYAAQCASTAETRAEPIIVLGTAHPVKFSEAIAAAQLENPPPLEQLAELHERTEAFTVLAADVNALKQKLLDRHR